MKENVSYPKIWPAIIFALLGFVCLILSTNNMYRIPDVFFGVSIVAVILMLVSWFICVRALHKTLGDLTDNHYPISPTQSWVLQMVPLFNLYWCFKWPSEIIDFVNHYETSKKRGRWTHGLIFFILFVFGRFLFGLGIVISFFVLKHLISEVKTAAANMSPGSGDYMQNTGKSRYNTPIVAVVLSFLVILGLIAAIAVPNVIRARDMARQNATQVQK